MCTFLSWTESFVDYSCPRRSGIKKLVAVDSCSQGVRCHNNFLYNCGPPLAELAHTSGKCMTLSDCRFCHKRSVPHCRITRCIVVSVMACEEHCTVKRHLFSEVGTPVELLCKICNERSLSFRKGLRWPSTLWLFVFRDLFNIIRTWYKLRAIHLWNRLVRWGWHHLRNHCFDRQGTTMCNCICCTQLRIGAKNGSGIPFSLRTKSPYCFVR